MVEFLIAFDKEANETVQRRRSENIASSPTGNENGMARHECRLTSLAGNLGLAR